MEGFLRASYYQNEWLFAGRLDIGLACPFRDALLSADAPQPWLIHQDLEFLSILVKFVILLGIIIALPFVLIFGFPCFCAGGCWNIWERQRCPCYCNFIIISIEAISSI